MHGFKSPEEMDPDDFVRWIFPHLVAHRMPRYEKIAEQYGYVVDANVAATVRDAQDLMDLIARTLDNAN